MSAKLCKYECGTLITWDNSKRVFLEHDGTPHTKERCGSLREKIQPVTDSVKGNTLPSNESKVSGMADVAAAIRELAAAIRSRPL